MTPEELIDAFDTLAEAPNGIERLRELVLQLAVRGKLVPQDPEDEPASVLLREAKKEREELITQKVIRRKQIPPASEDDLPYGLPDGWEWARIWDVAHDLGQQIPDSEFSYIDVSAIDNERGVIGEHLTVLAPENAPSRARKRVSRGSLIYSTVRPYLRNIAVVDRDIDPGPIASTAFCVLMPYSGFSVRYLYCYLRSQTFVEYVEAHQKGVAYPAITDHDFQRAYVPIPPEQEQHRIVAKVDELMTLIDQLEAARNARENARAALRDAALASLQDADTPEEVEVAWNRIAERIDDLFTDPADVDPLRQTILQLAVRGRLVPQDPNDEPASVLLERIAKEKERLVKEGKIRKPKPLPPVSEEDVPFDVPEGWVWVRGNELFQFVTSGSRGWAKFYSDHGPIFLRIGNLDYETTELDLTNIQRVTPPEGAEGSRTAVNAGDILISITGDTGMVGLVPEGLGAGYINQHIALCRPCSKLSPGFLARTFTSPLVRHQLWGYQRGIKNSLGLNDIRSLVIPLPPLPEQHRIVAKVDELMTCLHRLEERLKNKTTAHDAFAAAAVQGLTHEPHRRPRPRAVRHSAPSP